MEPTPTIIIIRNTKQLEVGLSKLKFGVVLLGLGVAAMQYSNYKKNNSLKKKLLDLTKKVEEIEWVNTEVDPDV